MSRRADDSGLALKETVLVVDAAGALRDQLPPLLRRAERDVYLAGSAREAVATLSAVRPDLVITSLSLPDLPGLSVLDALLARLQRVPVVVVSDQPSYDEAVAAIRRGAADYLGRDELSSRAVEVVQRALQERRARRDLINAQETVKDRFGFSRLVSQSPRMLEVFDKVRAVAPTDATVLVMGETGTGKELVAKAIHQRSRRREAPLISVNCGAFTESLLESELFGHEKGSFTGAIGRREGLFEMADGGSLFLDELGETTLNVQVNLLRVLEEMTFRRVGGREPVEVDVRIIAATNVRLEAAVEQGTFREDLFYRLNVFPIPLPPLRDRREDIPLLMRHFLDEIAAEYKLDPPHVSGEAIQAILEYRWPGNVRQLRAMCERWVITHAGKRLERQHLPPGMSGAAPVTDLASALTVVDESVSLKDNLLRVEQQLERAYLYRLLRKFHGHLGRTAEAAGVTRRTLYTKMKQYSFDADDFKPTP